MDTQPVSDHDLWLSDPYVAEVRDGMMYGRGAGDDKGSVASQLAALRALAKGQFEPGYRLTFAFVADEESGGERGTAFLKEHGYLQADAVIVGEQTNNDVAIGERGIVWLAIAFHGRPAHGAIPSAGVSALIPAAEFVQVLTAELTPKLSKRQSTPLLPAPSINIGRLTAGIDVSTVPDTAVVEIDLRIVPGETVEGCQAEVRSILDSVMKKYPAVSTSWSCRLASPAFLTSPEESLVKTASALAHAHGSGDLAGYHQASDARYFAGDGIPIVIFGPSDPRVGHAANECVAIQQLVEAQAFLEALCRSY
jgi:acetylornithine deacetylase/succinyl-diaminopimelate desuccinylase-like protein